MQRALGPFSFFSLVELLIFAYFCHSWIVCIHYVAGQFYRVKDYGTRRSR